MKRKRNFGNMADWKARDVQKALARTNWEITIDNEQDMYTCPKCECRMIADWYDLAVGTRGYNYCPYCGNDMRKEFQLTWTDR